MEITVLINNCVHRPDLKAEHGLSLWLDLGSDSILFDTGASDLVVNNAKTLGIHLEDTKGITLSHGHYDHTGGLLGVLKEINKPVSVWVHPAAFGEKGAVWGEGIRDIGLPFSLKTLEENGARFELSKEPRQLFPGIWLTGEIPRKTTFEDVEAILLKKVNNNWGQDPILDDQALVIDNPKGAIIITGCAHAGIINTISYGLDLINAKRLYAAIGGFHLWHASPERLQKTTEALKEYDPDLLVIGHCTGLDAGAKIKGIFGNKCIFLDVGLKLKF